MQACFDTLELNACSALVLCGIQKNVCACTGAHTQYEKHIATSRKGTQLNKDTKSVLLITWKYLLKCQGREKEIPRTYQYASGPEVYPKNVDSREFGS